MPLATPGQPPVVARRLSPSWPWRTDPKDGTGSSSLYEIFQADAE
jgi:hypothetical protein